MEFSLVTDCGHHNPTLQLLVLFFFLWPFITLTFLRRGKSPLPLLAMLLPFALASGMTWLGLARVIEVMAISGGGPASTAAGIAEALIPPVLAAMPAFFVGVAALARRHRATVDHYVKVFALAIAAEVVSAVMFTASLQPDKRQFTLALAWSVTAAVIALAIAARMAWYHRSRSNESSPVAA